MYKLFGMKLTNALIEKTAGSLFTGGVDLEDVKLATKQLHQKNIGIIPCYVVEGLRKTQNATLDAFETYTINAIRELAENQKHSKFALKLTAYVSVELMEKINIAQETFTRQILEVAYDP